MIKDRNKRLKLIIRESFEGITSLIELEYVFKYFQIGVRECLARTLVQNTRIGELDGPDDLGREKGPIFAILHEVGR